MMLMAILRRRPKLTLPLLAASASLLAAGLLLLFA
jgi:hypothetical protein